MTETFNWIWKSERGTMPASPHQSDTQSISGEPMTITVKFFASLRETVGRDECRLDSVATALDAWNAATDARAVPPNLLVAVNMEYAELSQALNDGDEVAFFPPVTGGAR
jgi:molybdopterin synthase sulfur carrier subunit